MGGELVAPLLIILTAFGMAGFALRWRRDRLPHDLARFGRWGRDIASEIAKETESKARVALVKWGVAGALGVTGIVTGGVVTAKLAPDVVARMSPTIFELEVGSVGTIDTLSASAAGISTVTAIPTSSVFLAQKPSGWNTLVEHEDFSTAPADSSGQYVGPGAFEQWVHGTANEGIKIADWSNNTQPCQGGTLTNYSVKCFFLDSIAGTGMASPPWVYESRFKQNEDGTGPYNVVLQPDWGRTNPSAGALDRVYIEWVECWEDASKGCGQTATSIDPAYRGGSKIVQLNFGGAGTLLQNTPTVFHWASITDTNSGSCPSGTGLWANYDGMTSSLAPGAGSNPDGYPYNPAPPACGLAYDYMHAEFRGQWSAHHICWDSSGSTTTLEFGVNGRIYGYWTDVLYGGTQLPDFFLFWWNNTHGGGSNNNDPYSRYIDDLQIWTGTSGSCNAPA